MSSTTTSNPYILRRDDRPWGEQSRYARDEWYEAYKEWIALLRSDRSDEEFAADDFETFMKARATHEFATLVKAMATSADRRAALVWLANEHMGSESLRLVSEGAKELQAKVDRKVEKWTARKKRLEKPEVKEGLEKSLAATKEYSSQCEKMTPESSAEAWAILKDKREAFFASSKVRRTLEDAGVRLPLELPLKNGGSIYFFPEEESNKSEDLPSYGDPMSLDAETSKAGSVPEESEESSSDEATVST